MADSIFGGINDSLGGTIRASTAGITDAIKSATEQLPDVVGNVIATLSTDAAAMLGDGTIVDAVVDAVADTDIDAATDADVEAQLDVDSVDAEVHGQIDEDIDAENEAAIEAASEAGADDESVGAE